MEIVGVLDYEKREKGTGCWVSVFSPEFQTQDIRIPLF